MILSFKCSRVNSNVGGEYFPMDEFIAKANIEHFKTQLKAERDERAASWSGYWPKKNKNWQRRCTAN